MYIREHRGPGHSCPNRGDIPGSGGTFFDFGSLFMYKTAWSSPSCDGSQKRFVQSQVTARDVPRDAPCGSHTDDDASYQAYTCIYIYIDIHI